MQKKYRRFLTILTFILVISSTIAYSALTSTLQIDAEARLRTVSDIRVSGISLSSTNGGTLQYESVYDVNTITSGFVLPTTNSSITYKVQVTNNGTIDQTIYDILTQSSNNSGLYYEISGYNVRDVIGFKSVIEFYITYKTTTPSNNVINVVNKFNFKKVYHVTFETKGGTSISEQIKYEGVDLTLTNNKPTLTGYTFKGWTDEQNGTTVKYNSGSSYTLDRDLILYAIYGYQNYTITYNITGGKLATGVTNPTSYNVGTATFTLNNPSKTVKITGKDNGTGATIGAATSKAQTFKGWTGANGTTAQTTVTQTKGSKTGDLTYTANWTPVAVNVPTLKKDGYDCKWNTKANGTGTNYTTTSTYTPTANSGESIDLFAICTPINYEIQYDLQGGKLSTTNPTTYNAETDTFTLNNPTQTGYTFTGWTGSNGTTPETTVTITKGSYGDKAYIANWQANSYNVKYLSGNYFKYKDLVEYGSRLSKDGDKYTLTTNIQYGGAQISENNFKNNGVYYLTFNVKKIYGTFVNIGGHPGAASQLEFQIDGVDSSRTYSNPSDNMSDKNDGNIHSVSFKFRYTPNATSTTDKNIYIQPNRGSNSALTVEITDLKLYELVDETEVVYGNTYENVPTATLTGYTFGGWYKDETYTNSVTNNTTVTTASDHNIYTKWTPNTYAITLNKNGATNTPTASITATYDSTTLSPSSITLPTRSYSVSGFELDSSRNSNGATVTGSTSLTSTYTFDGWTTSQNSGSVVINKAATPALVANISGYTDANGKWIRDNTAVAYAKWTGGNVTLPKITKTGYTCGWTESSTGTTITYASEESITPTANKTLYGVCVANTYTVTANSNGGSIASTTGWSGTGNTATKSVTYDNAYGTLPTVSRTSYTFKGWSQLPEGYTQVDYIQSSGTQYIKTNIVPTNTMGTYLKLSSSNIASDLLYFGSKGSTNDRFWVGNSNNKFYFGWNNVSYGQNISEGVPFIVQMNFLNNRLLVQDSTIIKNNISNFAESNTYPIYIFAGNASGTANFKSSIRIYEFVISDESIITHKFIPCINNATGKAGLYDLVEGKFYGNSGTGDFIAGDEEFITSETIVKETSNHNIYAHWTLNAPATPTISGGTTKIYGASATTLTCSSSTTYGTGINKYYSFVYATSDGGTPTNWTTPTTSATYSVPANAYAGQRWYSCRVYASDGTLTSTTSTSATTADTELKLKNAKLTFDKNTGTSGGGTVYTRINETKVFNAELGSTEATLPTASKTGYTPDGWYTATTGGSKVLNANGSFTGTAVTNYTGTNKWAVTADQTLYARWNAISYTIEYYQGTTKLGSSTHTYDAAKNLTAYSGTAPQGWAFSGWSTSDSSTSIIYTDGKSVSNLTSTNNGTVKLYAVFERTVRFNSGAASVTDRTQYYNPTATTNITAVSAPAPTVPVANKGWSAIGYRADKTAADKTYAVTTAAANITPAYNVYDSTTATSTTLNLYAVYSRTITLYHGKAKASGAVTRTQYCNISGNTVSAISAPAPSTTDLTGWTARGYRYDTTAADRSYAVTTSAANISPAYNIANTLYAVYSRTVTMAYNANGGTGTTASHNSTQYYNSNGGVSTVTFTTKANGFTYTGHTFSAWANDSATGAQVGAGGTTTFAPAVGATGTALTKTMYAIWDANKYDVSFNVNGGTGGQSATVEATYGSAMPTISTTAPTYTRLISGFGLDSSRKSNGATVTMPTQNVTSDNKIKSECTFGGWYDTDATSGGTQYYTAAGASARTWNKTADTTLYARWSGGSVSLPKITKTGYTCGWTESSTGTTIAYASEESITPSQNKTLYGVCVANTYTVNYYQGSTLLGSSTHTYDVAKALTAKATLGGTVPSAWSSFAGWTAPGQTNGTSVAHANSASVSNLTSVNNGTVNLYAVFTRNVSFKSGQNGTATNVAQYYNPTATTNVSAVTAPKMTAISNWTALGYRNDTTASTATVSASTTATGTVTPAYNQTTLSYNGVYSRSYTATFYSGVNKATTNKTKASTTAYYNSSSTNLPTTVSIVTMAASDSTDISGWDEAGWRNDTTAADKEYSYGATATVAFGTNFYSVYSRDLTMAYNSNGGTGTTESHTLPQYYNTNNSVSTVTFTTSANNFTRSGYTFNKWGTTAAGGTLVAAGETTTFAPAQSATGTSLTKTMYAQWTGNSYTITLNKNGATNTPTSSMTATYGTTNLAYTGTYTKPVKSYTVSGFTTNPDSTYDETRHSNGSTVSSTDDITSTATFNGWYTSSSDGTKVISSADMPSLQVSVSGYTDSSGNWSKDDNVTLYAQFDTQPAVELPTITKQGYTCGWTTSSTGTTITYSSGQTITPTSDLTLYGVCVQKKYTLVIDKRGGTYNGSTAPLTYENVAYNSPEFLKIITNRGTQGTPSKAGYNFSSWYYFQNAIQKPRDVSTDVNFSSGTAGLTRYDNNSTNSITISRISNGSYGSGSSYANPVGDWVMAISKSSAASTTPGMGGFYQIHSSAANKTYVHVFLASVGRGNYLQIANNGTATKEWLTPNEGTGGWQVYAYKIAFTSNPGTFGYIYYSTSPNGVGTAATAFSSKLGYSAVLDVTSDSSTSSPYGTPYLNGSGVIAAAFVPKINTITLSSSSSGVTVTNAGTTKIYERFDDGYYKGYSSSSGLSNKLTSTSANAIVVPTSSTHNFQGYYTGTNGTGTKIIGSNGKATANANTGNQFPNNGTLYASWTKKAQTTYSCRRRTVSYICSQQSCTPGYFFWSYASQCGQLPGYSYDGSGGPNGGYCTCTNPTCTAYNTSYGSWSGYSTYSSYPYTAGYEYQCTTT